MRTALTRRHLLIGTVAAMALPRVARAASAKVLMIGDSMIATALGQRLEYGLSREGLTVHRRGKSSSGLARPDFFDWLDEARKLHERHRPDSTVLMMGGNDTQSLKLEDGWINWGEDGWRGEYVSRVHDLLGIVSPNKEPVCWIGLPIVRSPGYRKKVERINGMLRDAVEAHRGGRFVSSWNALTRDGKYTQTMKLAGKQQDVRGEDGVHLTLAGAHLLERKVRPAVLESILKASS
jgi:hypothetical protein